MLYVSTSADYPNVSLAAPSFAVDGSGNPLVPQGCSVTSLAAGETCFDSVRGMARDGNIELSTTRYAMSVQLNLIGRALMCTPTAGGKNIPDYPDCP
jgi:hypothetical protein